MNSELNLDFSFGILSLTFFFSVVCFYTYIAFVCLPLVLFFCLKVKLVYWLFLD